MIFSVDEVEGRGWPPLPPHPQPGCLRSPLLTHVDHFGENHPASVASLRALIDFRRTLIAFGGNQ